VQYTITKGGEYPVGVEVVDDEKASSKSTDVTVYAGNEQPQVDTIELAVTRAFIFPAVRCSIPYALPMRVLP
jgi:cytochrome c